jgi:4-hydroxybenzoate polyprenyltransferase
MAPAPFRRRILSAGKRARLHELTTRTGLASHTYASRDSIAADESPVVVELGALLRKNTIPMESAMVLARREPGTFLQWLPCLLSRRPSTRALDESTSLDVTILPYDEGVVRFLRQERVRGRRVILAANGYPDIARRVARHLDVFDDVEIDRRLVGTTTAERPKEPRAPRSKLRDWGRALRLRQWLKNLLVLVPLVASHRYTEPALLLEAIVAFLSFGLMASGVYVLNDLLDISDDRHHATKRQRPFAAGHLSIGSGLLAIPILTASSLVLAAWLLPPRFALALVAYLGLTLTYSLTLKRRMLVDVIVLAVLYTLRIVAGCFAISVPLSFWLLAFSMFLFLSLALVKRYAELFPAHATGSSDKARGRGYWPADLYMIASLGAASGYMAILVMALYVNDAATMQLYGRPKLIWMACPLLLFWISRVWMLAHRGHMNEDPLVFAVRDRVSLAIGALVVCVFWAAR